MAFEISPKPKEQPITITISGGDIDTFDMLMFYAEEFMKENDRGSNATSEMLNAIREVLPK